MTAQQQLDYLECQAAFYEAQAKAALAAERDDEAVVSLRLYQSVQRDLDALRGIPASIGADSLMMLACEA